MTSVCAILGASVPAGMVPSPSGKIIVEWCGKSTQQVAPFAVDAALHFIAAARQWLGWGLELYILISTASDCLLFSLASSYSETPHQLPPPDGSAQTNLNKSG